MLRIWVYLWAILLTACAEQQARYDTADGQSIVADSPQVLMQKIFQNDLPLYRLPGLVLGMITPRHDVIFSHYDNRSYLKNVTLRDQVAGGYWEINLERYTVIDIGTGEEIAVPKRIEIEHKESAVGEHFIFEIA